MAVEKDFKADWKEGDGTVKSRRTHTYTHALQHPRAHFLSLRERGQYLEEGMVSHCYD